MEAAKDGYGEPEGAEGAEGGRIREDDFTVYQLYSPFHYLHQLMKALLRLIICFFFPFPRRQKTPTSEEEEEEEEEDEYRDWTWRRRPRGPRRKPGRPPIGTGGGGQTN